MISMIAAMGNNNVIGYKGKIPWGGQLSDDMKHFKRTTFDKPIIMGRKTWDSLPRKPLPNRINFVLTKDKLWYADGGLIVNSVDDVLKMSKHGEIIVIGGAEVYNLFMPHANKIYLTRIYSDFDGDTFFPQISNAWEIDSFYKGVVNENNKYLHDFRVLTRYRQNYGTN